MHSLWIDFITAQPILSDAKTIWPVYELGARQVAILDKELRIKSDPDTGERMAWTTWQPVAAE